MEDAMLIHRIARAPEKRVFFINVGSIPPNEVENFMQKTMKYDSSEDFLTILKRAHLKLAINT